MHKPTSAVPIQQMALGALVVKLKNCHTFCEDFKSAVLANTVIRIRNAKDDVVWCCADGEWRDKRFKSFTVDQDMNLYAVISALEELTQRGS